MTGKQFAQNMRYKARMAAGKPLAQTAAMTHVEVARVMTQRGYPMSRSRVFQLERRAIAKLRAALADLADQFSPTEE